MDGFVFFSAIQMSSHQCEQTFCPGRSKKDPHKSSLSCHQLFLLIGIQFPFAKNLHTVSFVEELKHGINTYRQPLEANLGSLQWLHNRIHKNSTSQWRDEIVKDLGDSISSQITSSPKVLGRPHSACHSEEHRLELPAHTRTIEARAAYFTLLHNFHFHWKQFHSERSSDAELFLFFIEIIEVDPWIWSVSLPFFASSLSPIHLQTLYLSILVHHQTI